MRAAAGPADALRFADGETWTPGGPARVFGIVNVTPDSFSDGGRFADPAAAVEHGRRLAEAGAAVLDVGGESTRPGAEPVDPDEESRRVVPVVEGLRRRLDVRISIDTRRAAVARRALDAGADVVNDVSALADPEMAGLVAERGVPVVLMHMRGTPETMRSLADYDDVVEDVGDFLRRAVEKAVAAGIADDKIVVDPGLGFAKSCSGNLALLRRLASVRRRAGRPILIGASRKSFIGSILDAPTDDRLEGSLAVAAWAAAHGADFVRVHDVAATVRVVTMIDAIRRG